jgi:hypothetical protein
VEKIDTDPEGVEADYQRAIHSLEYKIYCARKQAEDDEYEKWWRENELPALLAKDEADEKIRARKQCMSDFFLGCLIAIGGAFVKHELKDITKDKK